MPNRLAHETSPYLLQHAHNPVDWYPWGPEALARAAAEDRPILLSVGYSACHWCHVMERESFEDATIAAQMNRDFVCIKVDREERPDLDEIYMRAVQAFSGGHGGWPMTVFLTPSGKPFFGGTYFPPEPRGGMPGFRQVLDHAIGVYHDAEARAELTGELDEHLRTLGRLPRPADALGQAWLGSVAAASAEDFDPQNGGFGGAPKFPPHGLLPTLLAWHHRSGDPEALRMVTETLDAMARGGMYDLLGGGFARYSVDAEWRIPHFEKMLYDNAQLVPVYTDAWKLTGREHYANIVRQTLGYVLREMTHPEGGFCAAQDADSEGEEGKFFVWTPRQLRDVLGLFDGMRASALLQVTEEGSFEHGTSVLRLEEPPRNPDDQALLDRALPALFAARQQRVAPNRDDKVITAWNAMMISAFARAGAAFEEPVWIDAARRGARFLLDTMRPEGRLLRTWKAGRAHLLAYLDDYALLVAALVDLYEADLDARWLDEAERLADQMVDLFWDEGEGGFFYSGRDAEALIVRSKHMIGGAEPSGNGVAALALLRLAALCGRDDLAARAEQVLRCYQALLSRAPRALGVEALAGAWRSGSTQEIGVVAAPGDPAGEALLRTVRRTYLPFAVLARSSPGRPEPRLPWMEGRDAVEGRATGYVCSHGACQLPVQDPAALAEQLRAVSTPARPSAPMRDHAPALPADPDAWLNTDAPLTLDRLAGNVVVLDFWTYCCINCMHVLPELAALEEDLAGQPVAVIGVHAAKFPAERERENVERALRRHRVRHPVVLDSAHDLWKQYTVNSWPTVIVLDPTGRIAWRQSGEVDRAQLRTAVGRVLEEGRAAGTLREPAWRLPNLPPPGGQLAFPGKVAVWPDNQLQAMGRDPYSAHARLYIADTGHHRVLEAALSLGPDGWPRARVLRCFGDGKPGLVDGDASTARFQGPQGLARFADTLWVADTENHALRAVDLRDGSVRTAAGTGSLGRGRPADPTRPRKVALRSPWDVAVTALRPGDLSTPGAVFLAMAGAHQIWVYLPEKEQIGAFVGSGREDHVDGPPSEAALAQPSGLSLFGRHLFFADSEVSSVRAFDLADHTVGTLVGKGLFDWGDQDGTGAEVRLQHPLGVAAHGDTVYVADTFNHKIKAISLQTGETRTLAGGSVSALREPGGLAVAGEHLIVADTNNHRLRALHRKSGELRDLPLEDGQV